MKKNEKNLKKRLLFVVATVGIIGLGAALFSALESYVLNISAHLEPALEVNPHGTWNLGTVFPEETFNTKLTISLSDSFQEENNVTGVLYRLVCKDSEKDPPADRNLCQFMTFTLQTPTGGIPFLGQKGPIHQKSLDKPQKTDAWTLDVSMPDCENAHQKEPLQKEVPCPIDLASEVNVEVLDINRIADKVPCAKENPAPECLPDLTVTIDSVTPFGEPFNDCLVEFTVTNGKHQKEAVAGPSTTFVDDNDGGISDNATPSLAPKESFSDFVFVLKGPNGVCDITAVADGFNDVVENNEGNNLDFFP